MKLIWSERARRDLFAIGDYIAQDHPAAARQHVNKLRKAMQRICKFPDSGRIVPEITNDLIRELVEGQYRMVYMIGRKAKTITVLTVFETHKLLRI